MTTLQWSRQAVIVALYNLHQDGVSLRADGITKADSRIHSALYYKGPTGTKYFNGLKDAREATALYAETQGDAEGAATIRAYNGKQPSGRKFTPEQFDPEKGKGFKSFARTAIGWAVSREAKRVRKRKELSLSSPVGEDREMIDIIAAPEEGPSGLPPNMMETIHTVVGELSDRHAKIIAQRFGFGDYEKQTLSEIGQEMGISKERVRQLEREALVKMACDPRISGLAGFLE
jgi:RNA polymerase sigma factor (sigma-70 family)